MQRIPMKLKPVSGLLIFLSILLLNACSIQKSWTPESVAAIQNTGRDYVVLLHGLWRDSSNLDEFEAYFTSRGYQVLNLDYPSRRHSIPEIEALFIRPILKAVPLEESQRIHFVTHSMGGIVLRLYFENNSLPQAGRSVMISPPNHGSNWADLLEERESYRSIAGPAAYGLRTKNNRLLESLGPATFDLGIIAGNKSYFNAENDLLPGEDDGMVAVESMKLEGMRDMIILHDHHRGLTRNKQAMQQAEHFIENGRFQRS